MKTPAPRARSNVDDMDAEITAALKALRATLAPADDSDEDYALTTVETFCAVAMRVLRKTNPSKIPQRVAHIGTPVPATGRGGAVKRSGFARAFEPRPAREWTADELPGPRVPAPRSASVQLALAPRPVVTIPKTPERRSTAIRESARGEECTVRIIGACTHDPETTIWSHLPSLAGGRGMGMKSIDEAGCYCCASCHDVVDGRRGLPPGASPTSVQLDWFNGHIRSLVRLKQKGLL